MSTTEKVIHPRWLRITHWINVCAVTVLVLSGWRIYDASPFFGFLIPSSLTLGGWLGGAIQWHFAAMWILVGNGIAYLLANVLSGRFPHRFLPLSPKAVLSDLASALKGKLSHADPAHYNAVQKAAYVFVIIDTVMLVVSGLVLWKSVQFPTLRILLGGYESARRVHFLAMSALVSFVFVHVAMVALFPRTLLAMIRGR
jgi:thiosulfate reductase cytochrome b subunit